jgi:hypothetical protein
LFTGSAAPVKNRLSRPADNRVTPRTVKTKRENRGDNLKVETGMRCFGVRAVQGLGGLFLLVSSSAALAQAVVPQVLSTSAPMRLDFLRDTAPPLRLDLDLGELRWTGAKREPGQPRLSVVELEPDFRPGLAPRRAHHALKMRAEWPRAALRSMGFAAAECTTQFRMPSSLAPTRGGLSVELRAQLRLACSF